MIISIIGIMNDVSPNIMINRMIINKFVYIGHHIINTIYFNPDVYYEYNNSIDMMITELINNDIIHEYDDFQLLSYGEQIRYEISVIQKTQYDDIKEMIDIINKEFVFNNIPMSNMILMYLLRMCVCHRTGESIQTDNIINCMKSNMEYQDQKTISIVKGMYNKLLPLINKNE